MRTLVRLFLLLILILPLGGAPVAAQQGALTRIAVGDPLPPLSGVDLQGVPVDLADYQGRTPLVLAFWSVHCSDCIRELDDVSAIRREFPPGDLTVVAVNTDSGLPLGRIAGFVRRYEASRGRPMGVVHLLDRQAAVVESLGIQYIPLLVVADGSGRVSSVLTGYEPGDRPRIAQAVEEGRLRLGAWSEGLRGRLLTVLRGPGVGGAAEWGSFRVEESMGLFGLYDAGGWIAEASGRSVRSREASRVEAVVADRLRLGLLVEALASVGVRLAPPDYRPYTAAGIRVPESPFDAAPGWARLYQALGFDELFRVEERASAWIGDEYLAGLVGDVDLGRLRQRLAALDVPAEPVRIRLQGVSDFDYKLRAVLEQLQRTSYRLRAIQGEQLVYHGDAAKLAAELRGLAGIPLAVYVEVLEPEVVRLEVY